MLTVVSPAKTLDYETELPKVKTSKARLLEQSAPLVDVLRTKKPWELSKLMGISDELAVLNSNRYQQWKLPFRAPAARPAIYAFKGDVYAGLDAYALAEQDIQFAQGHLRILSGLYGVLKPLDRILPYRLEMGTRLTVNGHANLYQYWGNQITELIKKDLARTRTKVLVNLASQEYFKVVKSAQLKAKVVTPVFLDRKGGEYKMVSFWAKKARGLMARFILQNQLQEPGQLTEFDTDGYYFSGERSDEQKLVFLRDHPQ